MTIPALSLMLHTRRTESVQNGFRYLDYFDREFACAYGVSPKNEPQTAAAVQTTDDPNSQLK